MNNSILKLSLFTLCIFFTCSIFAQEQYNKVAGMNVIYEDSEEVTDLKEANKPFRIIKKKDKKTGKIIETKVKRKEIKNDTYGNAHGNQYDLARDGAFEGSTIAVLHFYTGENFDFSLPKSALEEKGFNIFRWIGKAPSPEELKEGLDKSCQLWIISDATQHLNDEHLKVIKDFFKKGHGVYIWGDNAPYYADANFVGSALLDIEMQGNLMGNKTVGLTGGDVKKGLKANHLVTTGIQQLYEGITIATVDDNSHLTPILYGSEGNLVTAVYEKNGRRAIFDGGFTRLYVNWDTAGTGRYVKNAAAWLVNVEKFDAEEIK